MRTVWFVLTLMLAAAWSHGVAVAAGVSDQERTRAIVARMNADGAQITRDEFVAGALWFSAYHELGHLLIHEYDVPVLGGVEEDMADNYAVVTLSPNSKRAAMIAAVQFFLGMTIVKHTKPFDYSDEHTIDPQRAFRLACHLAGGWPDRFDAVARAFDPSERRMNMCARASRQAEVDWDRILKPEWSMIEKQTALVAYVRPKPELENEANVLKASGVLESVASELHTYRLPVWRREQQKRINEALAQGGFRSRDMERSKQRVEIIGAACGQQNALTHPATRPQPGALGDSPLDPHPAQIIICYELVDLLHELADGMGLKGAGQSGAQ